MAVKFLNYFMTFVFGSISTCLYLGFKIQHILRDKKYYNSDDVIETTFEDIPLDPSPWDKKYNNSDDTRR